MLSTVLSKRKSCPDSEGALQLSVGPNQIITQRRKTTAVVSVLLKGRHPTQLVSPKRRQEGGTRELWFETTGAKVPAWPACHRLSKLSRWLCAQGSNGKGRGSLERAGQSLPSSPLRPHRWGSLGCCRLAALRVPSERGACMWPKLSCLHVNTGAPTRLCLTQGTEMTDSSCLQSGGSRLISNFHLNNSSLQLGEGPAALPGVASLGC